MKQNVVTKGFKTDNREIKISVLADDITLFTVDLEFVKKEFVDFSKYPGLSINLRKTEVKYIGGLYI